VIFVTLSPFAAAARAAASCAFVSASMLSVTGLISIPSRRSIPVRPMPPRISSIDDVFRSMFRPRAMSVATDTRRNASSRLPVARSCCARTRIISLSWNPVVFRNAVRYSSIRPRLTWYDMPRFRICCDTSAVTAPCSFDALIMSRSSSVTADAPMNAPDANAIARPRWWNAPEPAIAPRVSWSSSCRTSRALRTAPRESPVKTVRTCCSAMRQPPRPICFSQSRRLRAFSSATRSARSRCCHATNCRYGIER
jgi:hypothetical protein